MSDPASLIMAVVVDFVWQLKAHLKVQEDSITTYWEYGDTETGFGGREVISEEKLFAEIDAFTAKFAAEAKA